MEGGGEVRGGNTGTKDEVGRIIMSCFSCFFSVHMSLTVHGF